MNDNIKDNNDNDRRISVNGGGGGSVVSMSKKECTSCEQNDIDTITEGITSVAILDDVPTCANCGKEGSIDHMNICNKCK